MAMAAISIYDAVDRFLAKAVVNLLKSTTGVQLTSTPPTQGLPTVDTPTVLFLCILAYVAIVVLALRHIQRSNLKPRSHEPFLLQFIVIAHNTLCVGLSIYMCFGIALEAFRLKYKLWGNPYNEGETELAHFIYVFYMSKLLELMDTVIMLLKRNVRQVSVLHVYHHVSIAFIWWIIAHQAPGGDAYFSAAINSGVHVVMYLYYLLSAVFRNDEEKRSKYLFWGKYVTQLQMLQFLMNILQAYYCIKVEAPYPQFLCKILFYYMISLLFLFGNFYVQKHGNGKNQGKWKKAE